MKGLRPVQIKPAVVLSSKWEDYALEDSGGGKKLERFGSYRIIRHEPEAVWKPALPESAWQAADAEYIPAIGKMQGVWKKNPEMSSEWVIGYQGIQATLEIAGSQHIGCFPEQAANWQWIAQAVAAVGQPLKVLNLFGYTGIASLFAVRAGAAVTHVDASRKAVLLGKRNQALSGLSLSPVRWMVDDVLKFIAREARRGNRYSGLIMDPPKFGRGPKGEIWKLENDFEGFLAACREIMDPDLRFIIITAYQVDWSSEALGMGLAGLLPPGSRGIEAGEIIQLEQSAGRRIQQAIFARWAKGQ